MAVYGGECSDPPEIWTGDAWGTGAQEQHDGQPGEAGRFEHDNGVAAVTETELSELFRPVTTVRVGEHAKHHLRTVALARTYMRSGGWVPWTAAWWAEREADALAALAALRSAVMVTQALATR